MPEMKRLFALIAALALASQVTAQTLSMPIVRKSGANTNADASVLVDSSGAEKGTVGNPVYVSGGGGGGGTSDASAANQTSVQAVAGSDASKAVAVQGITGGKSLGVTPAATENHLGEIGGRTILASATFTTTSATTAWSSNQLIANSATAGSVTPMSFAVCRVNGGTGMLRRARVKVASDTGFAGQSVVMKFYRDSPTATNGDRATWLTTESTYLGQVSVTLDQHFSDFEKGIGTPSAGSEINFDCASGSQNIYGLLVSNGTITPAAGSRVVTVVTEVLAN